MNRYAKCLAAMLPCALMLTGCGQKGPLYLPDQTGEIVTRPAPPPLPAESAEAPNSPQTVDSPQGGASPAPEVTAPEPDQDKDKKDKGTATPPK
jgi:predicted small lipoprotein YifL